MLEDVEVTRSFIKSMKSTGEITEPWGTPSLMECRLERKPSTLTAIDLSERNLAIQLMRLFGIVAAMVIRAKMHWNLHGFQIAIDYGLEGKASHVKAKWCDLKDTCRKS